MFPLRDHNRSHTFPLITISLIIINVIVFLFGIAFGNTETFIQSYALIPSTIDFGNINTLYPFVTSMFLHGGWFHLVSNMWFLWIFGDNVEATFHQLGFILFYLIAGIAGSALQYVFSMQSPIPMLGASGAIAGVLGAYLVFFPHAQIETLVVGFGFWQRVHIPAKIMLLYWIGIQVFSGVGSIASGALAVGGVAWFAHIGGFAGGYAIARYFIRPRLGWYRIE